MKAVSYKAVISFINTETDLIDTGALKSRIKKLIHWAAVKSYTSETRIEKVATVDIKEGVGDLPCDLLRLLRVYPINKNGSSFLESTDRIRDQVSPYHPGVPYRHDTGKIYMQHMRNGKVEIVYYGTPTITINNNGVDEEVPAINHNQIEYCAYYAISKLLRDRFIRGAISGDAYMLFKNEEDRAYRAATATYDLISIDQMEFDLWMNRNAKYFH